MRMFPEFGQLFNFKMNFQLSKNLEVIFKESILGQRRYNSRDEADVTFKQILVCCDA